MIFLLFIYYCYLLFIDFLLCVIGKKAKDLVNKWVTKFGTEDFTFLFFVYDDSDWNEFEWHSKVIFIRYPRQGKYWYIKHFLPIDIARAYKTIWLGDDDIDVEYIDPKAFLQVPLFYLSFIYLFLLLRYNDCITHNKLVF